MGDFYSVLRQSMIDRDLRTAGEREGAYSQARGAMIRRLWSFDPPLAADEIDARIGLFDVAVDRIEQDLVETFAEADRARALRPPTDRRSRPAVAVVDGYDIEADYAPSFGGQAPAPARRSEPLPEPAPDVEDPWAPDPPPKPKPLTRHAVEERSRAVEERSRAVEAALRGAIFDDDLPAPPAARAAPPVAYDEPEDDPPPFDEPDDRYDTGYRDEPEDDRAGDNPAGDERGWAVEETSRSGRPLFDVPLDDDDDDVAPAPARPRRRPPPPAADRRRVRILLGAVAGLGVLLLAATAYLVVPLLVGASDVPTATGRPPVSGPETAARIPTEAADVAETFTLFDGRDPTVFEGAAGNPVRYAGSPDGGFARISTSAGSAGVRARIGPGLANRLAGRNIRVTMVARSSRENGATSLRFSYQSGVAISHWQTANLASDFTPLGLEWRVPTARTDPNGDYLIIEPGIPGDGTATDVQSIRIEVLRD